MRRVPRCCRLLLWYGGRTGQAPSGNWHPRPALLLVMGPTNPPASHLLQLGMKSAETVTLRRRRSGVSGCTANPRPALLLDDPQIHERRPERERVRLDTREAARFLHQLEEPFPRRKRRGGARQVLVCGAIAGEQAAHHGHHAAAVGAKERAKRAARLAEFEHHHAAAGLDHPRHLAQAAQRVVHVADAEGDRGHAEAARSARQGQRVGHREVNAVHFSQARRDHLGAEIGRHHAGAGAGELSRQISRAGGAVEHALSGPRAGEPHCRAAPAAVHAERENFVGRVVPAGDGGEHLPDFGAHRARARRRGVARQRSRPTASSESGVTSSRRPVACEGSTTTGRCVRCFASTTAERSSVLRVAVSKVRMPRSQRTTWSLPPASRYSAASSHSSTVAAGPRLSSTGRRRRDSAWSRVKFCMLRAPIWRSAERSSAGSWAGSITSVTAASPFRWADSNSSRAPSAPSPWNAYGLVRGLKAPPRRTAQPASATARAASSTCPALSTAHGPAMTTKARPPSSTGPRGPESRTTVPGMPGRRWTRRASSRIPCIRAFKTF